MTNDLSLLSERERSVLRLVATGATNQQIADQLDISPNTVKVHLRNIFGKIGAASRTEATMYAVRAGLVSVAIGAAESTAVATSAAADAAATARIEIPFEETAAPTPLDLADVAPPVEPTRSQAPVVLPEPPYTPERQPDAPPAAGARDTVLSRRFVGVLGVFAGVVLSVAVLIVWQRFVPTSIAVHDPMLGPTVAVPGVSGNWIERKAPEFAFTGAAAVNYGPIFVIGGWNGTQVLNSTLRYDPITDAWTELASKPTAARDIQAAVLGGKIFVPGGKLADGTVSDVLEVFDPQTKSWNTSVKLPAPRSAYGLAVIEGRLYLFGGWDGAAYRSEVFRFDPGANRWDTLTPMPTARAYNCVATDPQGNVFVIGGENSAGPLYTSEEYVSANDNGQTARPWSQRKPLPQPRSRSGCGAVENEIYLFGGAEDETTLRYDLRTDAWQPLSAPATPIGTQPAVVYRDGVFYITGGGSDAQPSAQLYGFPVRYSITVPVQQ